jgi:hypothetical protein
MNETRTFSAVAEDEITAAEAFSGVLRAAGKAT